MKAKDSNILELQKKQAELDKQIEALNNERVGVRNILYQKIDIPKAKALLGKCFCYISRRGKWDVFKVTGNDGGLITGTRIYKSYKKAKYGYDETRIDRKGFIQPDQLNQWKEITAFEFEKRVTDMLEY